MTDTIEITEVTQTIEILDATVIAGGSGDLAAHEADTTNVHGITNTAALATTAALSAHESDTTNVHGIADTSALATTAALAAKQDADADLTAIAALSTTSFGRSLLTMANAAAVRAALASTWRATVLADSPSLYWPLDDTYGATDQSGSANNGTASGGITIGGFSDSPIPGGSKCTDFDGTNDRITSSYTGCFTNGTVATFEGWAKRDGHSAYHQLLGDVGNNANGLRIDTGSQQVVFNAGSGTFNWAGAWPRDGEWVHWVLVSDEPNNMAELYINGVSKGASYTSWAWGAAGGVQLGNRQDTALPWDGKMAEFAIYSSLLSARRIMTHYLTGIGALVQ